MILWKNIPVAAGGMRFPNPRIDDDVFVHKRRMWIIGKLANAIKQPEGKIGKTFSAYIATKHVSRMRLTQLV